MSNQHRVIGRDEEQDTLERLLNSKNPEFLAIYGRRRVGKTFLIREYFADKDCYFFYVTGIQKEPIARQIKEFTKEISHVFFSNAELKEKTNWFDTFEFLTNTIQSQVPEDKKIILFFDEFPWMVTHRSKLLQALDYYWNRFWSLDPKIKLIICGSSAAWIIRNIINNKAGLHNRLTQTIHLKPMSLWETKRYLHHAGIKLTSKHILQIYMVTGGIPYYLSRVEPNQSAAQVIDQLAFSENSFLMNEFNKLYSSLFHDSETYIYLVRAIAQKRYGINQTDLYKNVESISKGGTIVKKLQDLEDAGFIISFTPYKNKRKGIYYRVIDEYTLFYFKWIEPIKNSLTQQSLRKGYWASMQTSPSWRSWSGYAFESVCYKHLKQISEALSLSPSAIAGSWRYIPKKSHRRWCTS